MPTSNTAAQAPVPQLQEKREITSLSDLFEWIDKWHKHKGFGSSEVTKRDYVWYHGHEDDSYRPSPSIYRTEITRRLKGNKSEAKRMDFERELLHQFRTTGAHLLPQANDAVGLYLLARHHDLPSRLLDWSTDPLTALYFAVKDPDKDDRDGHILIMDAQYVSRESEFGPREQTKSRKYERPTHVHSVRMPYVRAAIEWMFWKKDPPKRLLKPFTIIPIRPDNQDGRIFQQSSCFTFHMEDCQVVKNHTMRRAVIPKGDKKKLRAELRRANVNIFSVYYDLDHLVKHIKAQWKIEKSGTLFIETFQHCSSCHSVRARPLAGQELSTELNVECSSTMRESHPVGTIFRIRAEQTDREGTPFLFSHHSWPYTIVTRAEAEQAIASPPQEDAE